VGLKLSFGALSPHGGLVGTGDAWILGTSTTAGTSTFTLQARDSSTPPATATVSLSITIAATGSPLGLAITLSGPSGPLTTAPPGQQSALTVALNAPATQALTGTLNLQFTSPTGVDDQMVRFLNTTDPRTTSFTIPAASTQAVFPNGPVLVITGTVTGTINPVPSLQLAVNKVPPVITKVTASQGINTFSVSVTGFSTSRDMTNVTFHFVATSTTTIA
jgi:hypothetical protein